MRLILLEREEARWVSPNKSESGKPCSQLHCYATTLTSFTRFAKEILQKEMLPHVGVAEFNETKKAFFFGYIVHRLLLSVLERRATDDRDHYGNKRLDLAGPLLRGLFRQLLRKLTKDAKNYLQKVTNLCARLAPCLHRV